jgi:hypothetical protein
MSLEEFGRLVAAGMARQGMGQGKLAVLIGVLPDGKTMDATQIRLIIQGKRRTLNGVLVQRIAEVLELDPAEAHYQAGTWPPGLEPEHLRDISERLTTRQMTAAGRVASRVEGASSAATASSISPPEDLMRSCAPAAGQGMREAA